MEPRLIVHGGAWNIPDEYEADHIRGVFQAVAVAYPLLSNGSSALDAVEAAVKTMEADPTFDAGKGAFLNALGEIELDAMIMDGRSLNFGAVAAVKNILHPVTLARLVMEKTEHCLLVGAGAQRFAKQMGLPELDARELLTSRELAYYEQIKADANFTSRHPFQAVPDGTVGAVARDRYGHLAAATSTGGTPRKLPGRVGDSPLVGAGAYADDERGAVSATGWGESIMKILLSKTACDLLDRHQAMAAVKMAVAVLERRAQGWGGLILIDHGGNYGFDHNTTKMAYAYADSNGEIVARIRK